MFNDNKVQILKKKFFFGVPHLASYIFLSFHEPGLGTLIDLA
jgi:hypothetical protein